jgi:rubrerythrin
MSKDIAYSIRMSAEEYKMLQRQAAREGMKSIAEMVRARIRAAEEHYNRHAEIKAAVKEAMLEIDKGL